MHISALRPSCVRVSYKECLAVTTKRLYFSSWGREGIDAHLTLFLLELYLDVGELGPELLVGSLQGGQGVRLVPPRAAAGALLGHGEAVAGTASRSGRLVLPSAHYIFSPAWGKHSPSAPGTGGDAAPARSSARRTAPRKARGARRPAPAALPALSKG